MSREIAIKVENLSKVYQLGQIGTGTISRDLERWYSRMRGKEDPFLRIGESNNQNTKSESDVVWSLKDINFEIEQGDAVGIIGRNGAGKSTLLKILSKVTAPTTGKISGKGRIASLLEVGTGFHPELSGRENIFLNGAILGMRKKEIQRKLEEIVDFAGIGRYLDTPVKRYSSGMYVRLAFAVAAHLESEILIVDEVLAVGDAEFQKKCLGKMGEVSKGEGRTVLFVSHNMAAIGQLCNNSIFLSKGNLKDYGATRKVIGRYLTDQSNSVVKIVERSDRQGSQKIKLKNIELIDLNKKKLSKVNSGDSFSIQLELIAESDYQNKDLEISIGIDNILKERITFISNKQAGQNLIFSKNCQIITIEVIIKNLSLVAGEYAFTSFIAGNGEIYDWLQNAFILNVELDNYHKNNIPYPINQGHFNLDYSFSVI